MFDRTRLGRIDSWLADLVAENELPCADLLIADETSICHRTRSNVSEDALFRIYSMTKPLVSVALLTLYEQGRVQLDDPVAKFIPSFGDLKVAVPGAGRDLATRPAQTVLTIHHLLTHTSGLTYGLFNDGPLGRAYRAAKVAFVPDDGTLAEVCDRLAALPVAFEPGTRWEYGVSTDVLGRVIEVITGQPLDQALEALVLGPLGMVDTSFAVPTDKAERLVPLYNRAGPGRLIEVDPAGAASRWTADGKPRCFSGGAGLVSSMKDYLQFARCLLNEGRMDNGERLLSPATVRFAVSNHLPGDIASFGMPSFSEMPMTGVGFGLGFGVIDSPALARMHTSPGDFGWGGYASTVFWVDPVEKFTAIFMTQQLPSGAVPLRPTLRAMLSAARTN